jgi:hypothetical protein
MIWQEKESWWFDGSLFHTKLTVTVTIAECDIDPLVAVTVMV